MITLPLPDRLGEEFVREAKQRYGEEGIVRALVEAVEQWLARHQEARQPPPVPDKLPVSSEQELADSKWLDEHSEELIEKYADKVVAVLRGEVIAVVDTWGEAEKTASGKAGDRDRPVLALVDDGSYVY